MALKKRWQRMVYEGLRKFVSGCVPPLICLLLASVYEFFWKDGAAFFRTAFWFALVFPAWAIISWLDQHSWDDLQEVDHPSGIAGFPEEPSEHSSQDR